MNRDSHLDRLKDSEEVWDLLVVGGGATGLATAMDAASRGHRVALIEQADFAKGTSSRSTKLVHGGVRYLKQGDVSLVLEALHERGLLCRNAPHLVHALPFVIPTYHWWEGPFYGIGLKVYDALAGELGLAPSRLLTREDVRELLPTIEDEGLTGGVVYFDGQFDDARLAVAMARTADAEGATLVTYARCAGLLRDGRGLVCGVEVVDEETGDRFAVRARVVVNATGVFVDGLRRMDQPGVKPMVTPSQGVHLVLPRRFLPGDSAIMIPKTDDGRVLFAVPWHDCVILGTTDTPMGEASLEPRALKEELAFLMTHAARYLTEDPVAADVLSVFAGQRPLVAAAERGDGGTAALSRDHTIEISRSGLLTVTGGKWTTCRRMGQDVVDQAQLLGGLSRQPCVTERLRIWGYEEGAGSVYGTDQREIDLLVELDPELGELLHRELPYRAAEVVWQVREEMARTVEDVLARRTRALLLNARASLEAAPKVARLMAGELGRGEAWVEEQVRAYCLLAGGYIMGEGE